MIEAAHAFVASGKPPRRSVMFIANTAEELGLLGADYFAAHPTVPASSIVGLVDLDMPLLLYPFTDVIAFGADRSTVATAVAEAGRSMGVSVSPDPMPQESIFVRSDHYRFVTRGIPAILLMTGYANGGEAQWKNFLGKVYHTPADDLSPEDRLDRRGALRRAQLPHFAHARRRRRAALVVSRRLFRRPFRANGAARHAPSLNSSGAPT